MAIMLLFLKDWSRLNFNIYAPFSTKFKPEKELYSFTAFKSKLYILTEPVSSF